MTAALRPSRMWATAPRAKRRPQWELLRCVLCCIKAQAREGGQPRQPGGGGVPAATLTSSSTRARLGAPAVVWVVRDGRGTENSRTA